MPTSTVSSAGIVFKTSSFCHVGGCVAVATLPDQSRLMIDTKKGDALELHFTETEWSAFIAGVKNGEFD